MEAALAIINAHRAVYCLTESTTASTAQGDVRIALALACIRTTPVTRVLVVTAILAWALQEGNGLDRVVEPPEIGLGHELIPSCPAVGTRWARVAHVAVDYSTSM